MPVDLGPLTDDDVRRLAGRVRPRRIEVQLDPSGQARRRQPVRRHRAGAHRQRAATIAPVRLARSCSAGSASTRPPLLTRVALLGADVRHRRVRRRVRCRRGRRRTTLLDEALAAGVVEPTGAGLPLPPHAGARRAARRRFRRTACCPLHRRARRRPCASSAPPRRGSPTSCSQAGDVGAAAPYLLQAARTDGRASGAYRDALALIDAVRQDVRGPERGPAARPARGPADGDGRRRCRRTRTGRRWRATDDPRRAQAAACRGWPAPPRSPATTRPRPRRSTGWNRTGPPTTPRSCSRAASCAYFTGDLAGAEVAADEARRRLGLADPGDWRMFDLDHPAGPDRAPARASGSTGSPLELRAGAERPDAGDARCSTPTCASAEYLLYGPTPYAEVLALAAELRDVGASGPACCAPSRSPPRCAARRPCSRATWSSPSAELTEAAELHHDIGSTAGEAHSLQRLAEVRLAQGDRAEATAAAAARAPAGPVVGDRAAPAPTRLRDDDRAPRRTPTAARAVVDQAEAALGEDDRVHASATIMLAVPAAMACADAGDLDDARATCARPSARPRCGRGRPGRPAIVEARAHLHRAEGDAETARRRLIEAAELVQRRGPAPRREPLPRLTARLSHPGRRGAQRDGVLARWCAELAAVLAAEL